MGYGFLKRFLWLLSFHITEYGFWPVALTLGGGALGAVLLWGLLRGLHLRNPKVFNAVVAALALLVIGAAVTIAAIGLARLHGFWPAVVSAFVAILILVVLALVGRLVEGRWQKEGLEVRPPSDVTSVTNTLERAEPQGVAVTWGWPDCSGNSSPAHLPPTSEA
jgi:hypothetical protein